MSYQIDIERRLNEAFKPSFLKIINESEKHRGHIDGPQGVGMAETHFSIKMICDKFQGLSRLERHRAVYEVLANLVPKPIHALRLELLSPIRD